MRCLILQAFTSTSSQWALEKDLLSILSPSEIWKPNNGLIPRRVARTRRTGCARSTSRMTNPGPGPVSTRKSTHVRTFRVCACAYTRMYLPSRSGKVSSSARAYAALLESYLYRNMVGNAPVERKREHDSSRKQRFNCVRIRSDTLSGYKYERNNEG